MRTICPTYVKLSIKYIQNYGIKIEQFFVGTRKEVVQNWQMGTSFRNRASIASEPRRIQRRLLMIGYSTLSSQLYAHTKVPWIFKLGAILKSNMSQKKHYHKFFL